MKTTKKLLCTLLVALLVLASAPIVGLTNLDLGIVASAEEEIVTSDQCGDNAYWNFDTETGTLTVSGTGDMWDGELGFGTKDKDDPRLKCLVIENGITSVGAMNFYYCTHLTSVTLPDSVRKIGDNAFNYCTHINSINIPKYVESIGEAAFSDCIFIEGFALPATLRSIGKNAFVRCISVTSITVDENNAYYSSDSRGVLFDKNKTKLIQYPAGNEETTYTVPSTVEYIASWAFGYAMYLKDVALPEGLNNISDHAFDAALSLSSINLPESLEYLGSEVFLLCLGLTELTLPKGLKEVGNTVAIECPYLVKINVKSMNTTFGETPMGLASFYVEGISQEEFIELYIQYVRTGSETANNYVKESTQENYMRGVIYCHAGSTAERKANAYGIPCVTTHFFEGDWTYDNDNSIRYRKCTLCDEREVEQIIDKPDDGKGDDKGDDKGDNNNNNSDNTSFFQKIIDFFRSIFEKIKNLFK